MLNQYYDNENVILVQSKNLRFTFEEPVAWTRDGEAGGVTTDVRLSNNHAAIHIIACHPQKRLKKPPQMRIIKELPI